MQKRTMNLTGMLKGFLQSYLRWLYEQNSEFAQNLTPEEISEFLLHQVFLPVWFQICLKQDSFFLLIEILQYIQVYASSAKNFSITQPIELIVTFEGIKQVEWKGERAAIQEINWLTNLCKRENFRIPKSFTHPDFILSSTLENERRVKNAEKNRSASRI
ncbi:hypothetical protein [Ileibacterium valens]|uniref:hypothetical protein n=1 Tax=Ileibacterium valens TaxID=1862668 RepID=UPI00256FB1C7|nr:hypothetical protein [Ileibacterium valens]